MIIIGKSDLRIDLDSLTLSSNLGYADSQFVSQKTKGKDIIGGKDQIFIERMEFYSL